ERQGNGALLLAANDTANFGGAFGRAGHDLIYGGVRPARRGTGLVEKEHSFFAAANNGELQPLSAEDFDRSGAGIGVRLETKRANGFWIRIDRPGARAPMDLETVRF